MRCMLTVASPDTVSRRLMRSTFLARVMIQVTIEFFRRQKTRTIQRVAWTGCQSMDMARKANIVVIDGEEVLTDPEIGVSFGDDWS